MDLEQFDYVNLNEVDPTLKPVPQAVYTLKVIKAETRKGVSEASKKPWARFEFVFQIVDHPTLAGRRVYDGMFANESSLRFLRKLMDATGVTQASGSTLSDWFATLTKEQPEVKYLTKVVSESMPDGETVPRNRISWNDVATA